MQFFLWRVGAVIGMLCCLSTALRSEDVLEFLTGTKARGTVKEIRADEKELDFEVQLGSRRVLRTYRFDQLHAVTRNGRRQVLNERNAASSNPDAQQSDGNVTRSREEVLALINSVGSTPPEWFDSTPLDYPRTLDLDWPIKAPKGWNNQKNIGQYKWDIINPNPNRWRSGVRLMHELMARHKDDPQRLRRDMKALAEIYFELFQDYPRAAFWLRRAQVKLPDPQGVHLAECYWRLGNKPMALQLLQSKRLPINAIKLLGDMGQTDRAIRLAKSFGRNYPDRAHEPYLLAGDACRKAGRYDEAIDFYQRVLRAGDARNEEYHRIYVGRAKDSIEAIELFDRADVRRVADGVYRAASTGYNGQVEVEVTVADGRIKQVRVSRHEEKQFYAALTDTPQQIIVKQSVKGIDATSRATITSQAIVNSTAKALAQGSK